MAGYIGSKAVVVSSGAERKKTFAITTSTTSLTGLAYTPNQVHVFHNGIRLVDGTDYTATDGTTITLTNAAANGDEVVVVSYAAFQTSDTVSASAGGTFVGDVTFGGAFTSQGIDDNATSTAITLDSSGNLLVGQATANAALVGASIRSDGEVVATCSGAAAGSFNRIDSDGAVVDVKQDGVIVGSLAADVMDFLVIGKDETGLGFVHDAVDTGGPRIIPRRVGSAAPSDGLVDLGDTGSRFRDLHISRRVVYDGTNVRSVVGSTYNSFNNLNSTTTNGAWVTASGSTFTYTPQRSDTTISVFADVNLGYAWEDVSGTNHGEILARIVIQNTAGTFFSSEMSHWGRVDTFTGVFESTANHKEEYHLSPSVNNGSTITVYIQYQRVVTAGAGPSRGGVNTWGSNSVITLEEYI